MMIDQQNKEGCLKHKNLWCFRLSVVHAQNGLTQISSKDLIGKKLVINFLSFFVEK